jgi:hypothetical protein
MKQLCVLLLTVAIPGCFFSLPFVNNKEEEKPAVTVQRSPVLPEQVKENNAHKIAESLEEEVAIDETTPAVKPEEKDKEKDKDKKKKP